MILYAKWVPVQIRNIAAMYTMIVGNKLTLDPQPAGGTWEWDEEFFSATFNSPATFTALKEGISTIIYTVNDVALEIDVTVQVVEEEEDLGELPVTGGSPYLALGFLSLTAGIVLKKKKAK
jgi:hypothetical protein